MPAAFKQSVLRLPEEFHAEVKATAAKRRTSIQDAVVEGLRMWLKHEEISSTATDKTTASVGAAGVLERLDTLQHSVDQVLSIITSTEPRKIAGISNIVQDKTKLPKGKPGVTEALSVSSHKDAEKESGALGVTPDIAEVLARHGRGTERTGPRTPARPGKQKKAPGDDRRRGGH